jgi:hypothetical protein
MEPGLVQPDLVFEELRVEQVDRRPDGDVIPIRVAVTSREVVPGSASRADATASSVD